MTLLLATAYLAPVQYYAHLYAATGAVEDRGEHFRKQTYRNRCYIATPAGPLALTIPVVREGAGHTPICDIRISDHGNWRHLHWQALQSAYERSPYFFYYADDFRPLFERRFEYLADFNEALRQTVLGLLGLDRPVRPTSHYVSAPPESTLDLRETISPKAPAGADPLFRSAPYYQVFASRTGFLPNLSIADLLFNLGPESHLILRQSLATPAPPDFPKGRKQTTGSTSFLQEK